MSGSSGFGGNGSNGDMTLLNNKVIVPATIWKVVLILDRLGLKPKNVTQKVNRTIAIVVPNQQGVKSKPWKDYITSVDEVEKLTGYDFFSNLPKRVQKIIEATNDRVSAGITVGGRSALARILQR